MRPRVLIITVLALSVVGSGASLAAVGTADAATAEPGVVVGPGQAGADGVESIPTDRRHARTAETAVGQSAAPGQGVSIERGDFSQSDDEGDDIRISNENVAVQINGEDLIDATDERVGDQPALVSTIRRSQSGDDLTEPIVAAPRSPANDELNTGFVVDKRFVSREGVGGVDILRQYNYQNQPVQLLTKIRVFEGAETVRVNVTFRNEGRSSITFRDTRSGSSDFRLVDNFRIADPTGTYRFHVEGSGSRRFTTAQSGETFPIDGAPPFVTVFTDDDAVSLGLLDGPTGASTTTTAGAPPSWLALSAGETSILGEKQKSYQLAIGPHDAGANAPASGRDLLQSVDPRPDVDPADLRSITIGETATGEISQSDRVAERFRGFYEPVTFSGTADQQLRIDMRSAGGDPYLFLVDPDGKIVAENDNGGGNLDAQIARRLRKSGTYQIVAATAESPEESRNFTGGLPSQQFLRYNLSLNTIDSLDLREIAPGETKQGRVDPLDPNGSEPVNITLGSGQTIRVTMRSRTGDTELRLRGSGGDLIDVQSSTRRGNSTFLKTIDDGGEYTILAGPKTKGRTFDYVLSVRSIIDPGTLRRIGVGERREQRLVDLGDPKDDVLSGLYEPVRIDLTSGQRVMIEMSATSIRPFDNDAALFVFGPDDQTISRDSLVAVDDDGGDTTSGSGTSGLFGSFCSDLDSATTGCDARINFTPEESGRYRIMAADGNFTNFSDTYRYDLSVTQISSAPDPRRIRSPNQNTTSVKGEIDTGDPESEQYNGHHERIDIRGTQGQRLRFTVDPEHDLGDFDGNGGAGLCPDSVLADPADDTGTFVTACPSITQVTELTLLDPDGNAVATDLALDGVELTRLLRRTGNYTIVVHTPIEHRFRYDLSVTDLGLRRDLSEISIGAPPQQGEVDRKDPADPQFFGSYEPVEFTAEAGDVLRISANTNDPAHLWILNDTDAVLDTTTEDRTGGIDEDPAAPPGVGSPPGLTSSTNPVLVHRFEESGQFEVIVGPDPPLNAEVNLNANLRLENSTIVSSKQEDEFRYTLSVDYAYSGQDVGEIPSTGTDQRLGQIYANQTWHARLDAGDPSSQRFGGTYEIIRYNAMVQERIEFTHRSPGNNPRIYLLSPRQLGRNQPREIIRETTGRDEATFEHTFEQTDTYYIVVSSASGTGSSFALEAERKLEGRPITTVRLKPNRAQSTVGNVTTFDVVVFGLDQAPDEEGEDAGEGINGTALELNLGQPRTGTITRIDPAGNPADSSINLTNAGQRLVFNTSGQYWDGGPGGALGLFEGGFFDYNDYSVVDEQSDFQREAELTVNAVPVAQVRVTGVRQRPGGVAVALGAEKVLSAADADGTPFDGLEPDGYPLAVPSDSSFYRVFNPPSGPAPVAGSPPKDPDGDGKYEDVNGDGSVDERDVNLLYRVGIVGQGSPDTVRRFPISYDFNNDDEFGISDVQALLQEVRNP